MKSQNKRAKYWIKIRKEVVIPMFKEKGIESCELRLSPLCTGSLYTGFAHKHERYWYYRRRDLLGDFRQVLLTCVQCHALLDMRKELKQKKFKELRGD